MSFPSGGIAPIAQAQLAAWQALAADWPTYPDGPCRRCASCGQSIWRTEDDRGGRYAYSGGQILALTVAHLRQAHPGLDPDSGTSPGQGLCFAPKPSPGGAHDRKLLAKAFVTRALPGGA